MRSETITKYLIDVLIEEYKRLPDEAKREAESVMMYYEQIKKAEIRFLTSN
jgi:hypothetical protein